MIEQSPESIIITNLAAKIEYANATFIRNTGYSNEEVIGQNLGILKSGKTPIETYKEFWVTLLQGGVWQGELFKASSMACLNQRLHGLNDGSVKTFNESQ